MLSYFVLLHDFNTNKVKKHDIMPYLIDSFNECKEANCWWYKPDSNKAPESKEDFMDFVIRVCMHRYWSRCEYEWLMIDWPPGKTDTLEDCKKIIDSSIKIDAWDQIEPNIQVVVATFMANIKEL